MEYVLPLVETEQLDKDHADNIRGGSKLLRGLHGARFDGLLEPLQRNGDVDLWAKRLTSNGRRPIRWAQPPSTPRTRFDVEVTRRVTGHHNVPP